MRLLTRCVVGAAVVAVGAGCGNSEEQTFSPADLQRAVAVAPVTPGWGWPESRTDGRTFTRDDLGPHDTHPIQATLSRALRDAGFVQSEESSWRDVTKSGSAFANLFDSASGARAALAAYRVFARGWQSEVEGGDVAEVPADGLGDESWGLRQDAPGVRETASMTYDWRRDNLVLEVHVNCARACASDIGRAARDWADAIDEQLRAGS